MASYAIPAALFDSPLRRRGGWQLLEGWASPEICRALRAEAEAMYARAERTDSTAPDREEVRGGDPPRAFTSAVAGERQEALYQSQELRQRLEQEVGAPLRPSALRGTYTYYEQPGDHLAVHRDIQGCDITVVTCLRDEADPTSDRGAVCLWPGHLEGALSELRMAPDLGAVRVRLAVGETLLLLGGFLPHAVQPVAPGQDLLRSILCYQLETD
jgi:hypothetical protein